MLYCAAASSAEGAWDPESYNPKPANGDLILPMPCGGQMVFRQVNVPSSGALDDYRITLGSHEEDQGYAEYLLVTWLAGSFASADNAAERHYFIGKYEVTSMQYGSFGKQCPDPDDINLQQPATGVSWAEAMLFGESYSEWLMKNAADHVPTREDAVGFLRLPTEAEWEFAARGGTAVSPSEFAKTRFLPAGKKLDDYVIHDGNSYKEISLIGTLKPNPLGIHDILGNAAELVLSPFRLNVVSHLHGQAGGFVRRGGSFRTRAAEIRTSHREEYPPVDRHGIRREKTTGFRLALVAPVFSSLDNVKTVRLAWKSLQRPDRPQEAASPQLGREEADPVAEVRKLAEAAPNEEVKRRLKNLAFVIAESIRTRNQERERAARESLSSAVFAVRWAMSGLKIVRQVAKLADRAPDAKRRARYKKRLERARADADFNIGFYLDRLVALSEDYGDQELRRQAKVLRVLYTDRNLQVVLSLVDPVVEHAAEMRRFGSEARDGIIRSLGNL